MASSRKSRIAESSAPGEGGTAGLSALDPLEHLVAGALTDAGLGPGARVAVALSGGADSMTLLEMVHRLRDRLAIVPVGLHVHHGLSPHAGQWASLCEQACRARAMEFNLCRVSVRRAPGESLEARARDLRYQCFARCDAAVLLLAHHLDDQCETFLLRLFRGSGLHGLLAMPAARGLGEGVAAQHSGAPRLLRPLLTATRSQVREYAARRGLYWVEDESNADTAFTRNYLRTQVLPLIEARFPGYRQVVARAITGLTDAAGILDDVAQADLRAAAQGDALRLECLARVGDARALNALRAFLALRGCRPPARAHLEEAWRQLRTAAPDTGVRIRVDQGELRRYRDALHWVPARPVRRDEGQIVWRGEERIALPDGMGELVLHRAMGEGIRISLMRTGEVIACRARPGMRLKRSPASPARTLKNLFQEAAVPPWTRAATPALRIGADTLWVAGLGYDCRHLALPDEAGLRVEWVSAPRG